MTPRFIAGNAVDLLENGSQYFPALLAAINKATREIHLETYIFANDATAGAIVEAMIHARQRGVVVRVMVDGFGARNFLNELGERLIAAQCEVLIYRTEAARRWRRSRLRRLHRKLVVIDGCVAFVGGINVIDDLSDTAPDLPRFDFAVVVQGPVVADIHDAMRHVWRIVRWAHIGRRPPQAPTPLPVSPTSSGSMEAAFLVRDNLRHRKDIEEAYLLAIANAEKEVFIACAYFLPGLHFRRALMAAAQRGVVVTLLLQSKGDHPVIRHAERLLYRELLSSGIRIVEYHAGFLHAKVGVADRRWATVGSSNIDPFSLLLSREANLVVDDAGFADTLRERLLHAIDTGGKEVDMAAMNNRSWWARFLSRAAYAFVRFAVSVARYGGKYYRE